MIDRIYSHMQAMQVLSKSQEVTADNLSNINTPGFKGTRVFYRMLKENVDGREVTRSVPMQQVDLKQGVLEATGNKFDLGINGEGFFMVEENGQNFLTRDGRFNLDPDGFLINSRGAQVLGENGPVNLSSHFLASSLAGRMPQVEIRQDGTVFVDDMQAAQIRIVNVSDAGALERKGSAYFTLKENGTISDQNVGSLLQGYYEKGNVEPLSEMVDMMQNGQMFETQQRALRTSDEMLSQVTTKLGRF